MKELKYYEITRNGDSNEGRGPTVRTEIFFRHKSDALIFVKSSRYCQFGVMGTCGSEHDVRERTTKLPIIYDSLDAYDEANPDKEKLKRIQAAALAKLTDFEKKVLGLWV